MTDQTPVPPPPPPPAPSAAPAWPAAQTTGYASPPPPPPAPAAPVASGSGGSGKGRIAIIGGIVAAVLLGGGYGAYAVYDKLDGGGPQPHDVLPASTDAYLRLDLDPSASQKVDLFKLIREFPDVADELGIKSDKADLRELVFRNFLTSECDNVNYEDDVEPWLGDRVGVGFDADADAKDPGVLIAVQTKDEDKSRAGIKKLFACADDSYGVAYLDGYAIIGPKQSDVDDAVAEAKKSTLGDKEQFADDFDQLGNQGIASGWADFKALAKVPEIADAAGSEAAQLAKAGTVATTLRVDGSAVELAVLGGLEQKGGQKATSLADLPADTVAALSVSGGGKAVAEGYDSFIKQFESGFGSGLANSLVPPTADPATPTDPDASAIEPFADVDPVSSTTTPEPVAPLDPNGTPDPDLGGLDDDFGQDDTQLPPLLPTEGFGIQGFITEFEQSTGLQLPEDLQTLFGDNLTLAIGSKNLETIPTLSGPDGLSKLDVALSLTSDKDAAFDLVKRLAQLAGTNGVPLVADSTDDGAVLATNQDAADAITDPDGKLGDNDVFKSVIPSGDDTYGGFYVNVGAILDKVLDADPPKDVREFVDQAKVIKAVGVSVSTQDDDRPLTSLRIAFNK